MKARGVSFIIWIIVLGVVLGKYVLVPPFSETETNVSSDQNDEAYSLVYALEEMEDSLEQDTVLLDTVLLDSIRPDSVMPIRNACPVDTMVARKDSMVTKKIIREGMPSDPSRYLSAFFEGLKEAGEHSVRVVHYGDSQIEEDRITSVLRNKLQQLYGGGGVGLIPLYQTIPSLTIRQKVFMNGYPCNENNCPQRYLVYGPKRFRRADNRYGIMGQVAIMNDEGVKGSEDVTIRISPGTSGACREFNRIRLFTDDVEGQAKSSRSESYSLFDGETVAEIEDTKECEIRLQGMGEVYGISLETPNGVIVDNVPMRGCSGIIFTKIDSTQLADFYRDTHTRLIIMQYGGNMIPLNTKESTIRAYVRQLGEQVDFLKKCAPQASILFIGPGDMATMIDGELQTYPMVPYLDRQLGKMARDKHIAYWSMFEAMGGRGSMIQFRKQGLSGSDYVHFTRKGAKIVGEQLWEWLVSQQSNMQMEK